MKTSLQWGGRFSGAPDASLLAFGSSLEDDLPLASCDVQCCVAHVAALESGGVVNADVANELRAALSTVQREIADGSFFALARDARAEDIHGAIDARVRELAGAAGELLHAGRSRNDQVATTLKLFVAQQCELAATACAQAVRTLVQYAQDELGALTVVPAMTHWQPAQPALLAFWLCAAAQSLVRAADRCNAAAALAMDELPLGSAAVCGSTLPLDREAARANLHFSNVSANAMDAIGSRDTVLEGAHAVVLGLVTASRICEELIIWCNPLIGFAALDDAASTGSSLMPQKRNPDPLELVRGLSATAIGTYAGALASTSGLALSYQRDLQQTKASVVRIVTSGVDGLTAFGQTIAHVRFNRAAMNAAAGNGFTVATDIADGLVAGGATAREAHATVGAQVQALERDGKTFDDVLTPLESVFKKRTPGSTHPEHVAAHLTMLQRWLALQPL